jgi:hypothetical protein
MADIKVRLHNTLQNGWKIFQCHRSLGSNNFAYDKDEKAWTTNKRSMNLQKTRHPRTGSSLLKAMGGYFDCSSTTLANTVEIARISVLPAKDPVAVNAPTCTLKVGDILLCPPTTATHSLWKAATLPDVLAARKKAVQEGKTFYVMYFAQSPDDQDADETTTTTNHLTNHSTKNATPPIHDHPAVHRSTNSGTSISTAAPHSSNNNDNNNKDHLKEPVEQAASPTTASSSGRAPPPQQEEEMISQEVLDEKKDKAAAATPTAAKKVSFNSVVGTIPVPNPMSDAAAAEKEVEKEAFPVVTQDDPPTFAALPASTATSAATLLLPDHVPSESVLPVEQVSSSFDIAMTTKRRTSGRGGKKKRRRRQRQDVDEDSDEEEEDDDRSAVQQLPADVYDKLPLKLRHDALWQQASTKYELAQSLIGKCQEVWTTAQQQQLGNTTTDPVGTAVDPALDPPITVLHSYVLPAVPAKVAPPNHNEATADWYIMSQRMSDYTVAVLERNSELESYIAAMVAWTIRLDVAAQHWFDQSEQRHQNNTARQAAVDKVKDLQRAILAARVALQRIEVHEPDARRTYQQALAALLAVFSSATAS